MPVFRSDAPPPSWCEMESFEVVTMPAGTTRRLARASAKARVVVCSGACTLATGDSVTDAVEGSVVDAEGGTVEVRDVREDATLVVMRGRWREPLGGAGVFFAEHVEDGRNSGDPVDYEHHTSFDNHFHDCDEYWIVVEGDCEAVSEGACYRLRAGDCLATGMGHHHDMARVYAPVKAVYFETTLEGRKRLGHLWEHAHGKAEPKLERV